MSTSSKSKIVRLKAIPITPDEASALIELSAGDPAVELSVGRGLALFNTPDNKWAVTALRVMRSQELAS